jgi:hypothetical protein
LLLVPRKMASVTFMGLLDSFIGSLTSSGQDKTNCFSSSPA